MSNESGSQLARQARQLIRSKRYREAFQYAARARDQDPRCAQVGTFQIFLPEIVPDFFENPHFSDFFWDQQYVKKYVTISLDTLVIHPSTIS